ncbi:WD40-repeat-containing domain protein, partial [Paraphysoderma sedebokerense]
DFLSLLPIEISIHILSFLGAQDVARCALVSKKWNALTNDNAVWRNLYLRKGWFVDGEKAIGIGFTDKSLLKTDSLNGNSEFSDGIIPMDREEDQMINWKYLYYQRNLLSANMRKGQCVKYSFEGHEEGVYCAQMDEQRIISGSRDDTIKIWPLPSENADPSLPIQASHTLRGHTASVLCLQFTTTHIFSGSSDCTIRIWSLETYECVKTLRGHTEAVLNLRVLDDKIVSCSKDKTLRVWNFEGQELGVMRGHRAAVNAVALGTWRRQTKEPDQYRTIKLWSATTHDIVHTLEGHTRGIACLSFSAPYIFSGSSDQTIKIWSIDTLSCIRTLSGHTELVRTLTVDRELGVIVSGGYDCAIRVWEWEMFRHGTAGSIGHSNRVFNVGLTMGRVVSASQDMKVFLWDFRHGVDMRGLLKTL